MHSRLLWLAATATVTCALPVRAHDQSHSLEADQTDERAEGVSARQQASARVTWRDERWRRDPVVRVKLLGINDFHGQLSPRVVGARPAGGAAVLAAYLQAASAEAKDAAFIIHAGDQVGATPPNSALLQDEPAIGVLNLLANPHCRWFRLDRQEFGYGDWDGDQPAWQKPRLLPGVSKGPRPLSTGEQARCNIVGTLGNHEFDEGIGELLRLIDGGNHPKGPFLEPRWKGARFPYVSSNVVWKDSGKPVLPPYTVKKVAGDVRIGVIGAVLKETPTVVTPTGVVGLKFLDEADAINAAVRKLRRQGVSAIVVTIHQGIRQASYEGPTDASIQNLTGPIVDIVKRLDSAVDVVISGHAHGFTNALIKNAAGKDILVTQSFSASTAYGDIDLAISRRSGEVVEKSAAVVTTWGDVGPGLNPDTRVAQLVAAADERVAPLVSRIVGVASTALLRSENAAGESPLGNLIADAQRVVSGAQFSFMNPGGIRADLDAGEVTWGDLFTIQPFANDLVSLDLTGAQIDTLLEQQWQGQPTRILKISGLTYTWDAARPVGDRVVQILDASGTPLNPSATYRVTVNSFIAAGGDNFLVLPQGTNRVIGKVDLDALVEYVESLTQPFTIGIEGRITRLN
jgi:5'-nucleotidase